MGAVQDFLDVALDSSGIHCLFLKGKEGKHSLNYRPAPDGHKIRRYRKDRFLFSYKTALLNPPAIRPLTHLFLVEIWATKAHVKAECAATPPNSTATVPPYPSVTTV